MRTVGQLKFAKIFPYVSYVSHLVEGRSASDKMWCPAQAPPLWKIKSWAANCKLKLYAVCCRFNKRDIFFGYHLYPQRQFISRP